LGFEMIQTIQTRTASRVPTRPRGAPSRFRILLCRDLDRGRRAGQVFSVGITDYRVHRPDSLGRLAATRGKDSVGEDKNRSARSFTSATFVQDGNEK